MGMTSPTSSSRSSFRAPLLAALLGLLLLAGMVAFAVGLPEVSGAEKETSEAATGPIDLPDTLEGGFVAVDSPEFPAEVAAQFGDISALAEQEASVAANLGEIFEGEGAFRVYGRTDGSAVAQVTAINGSLGLFVPDALPIDPELIGAARPATEVARIDDAVCSIAWGEQIPQGTPVPTEGLPQTLRCQLAENGRVYEVSGQGISAQEAVDIAAALAQER